MAKEFLFGFKFLATDHVSPILKKIEGEIESVNAAVKNTARWREGGTNLATMGAGAMAAGAGIGLMVKSFVGAASDFENKMAGVAAVTGLTNSALALVKEHFETFSESHFAASAEQGVEVFGRLYQNLHNVTLAQKAADNAIKAAGATGANVTDVMTLMNAAHENLGTSSTAVANSLAATTRQYSLAPEAMQQMTLGIARLSPSLKMLHGNINDAMAIMGQAEQSMPGRGAQMIARLYEGLPEIANKAHLNLSGGMFGVLDQIQARIRGLAPTQQIDVLAGMKMDRTMAPEFLRQLAVLDKMRAARDAIARAGGTLLTAEEVRNASSFQHQSELLGHAWKNLEDTLGSALLPRLTSIVGKTESMVASVRHFARDNPEIVKIGMTFAAISAAVLVTGGGLAIAGGALMGFASFIPAVMKFAEATRLSAVATKVWTAAQWLLNAAMDANPIAIAIIAATALAVVAYEVYEHWATVKAFFMTWGSWAYTAGANLVKGLAGGIWSAITFPQHAMEAVVTKIRAYLPFSPAKEGPLRNLHRTRIVETIADTIRPGPAIAAIRRTAAAIAIAAPMTLAPMIASPAMAGARGGAGGGGSGTTIVYSPTINMPPGSNTADLMATLRQHSRELKEIIEGRTAHESRREF